MTPRRQYRIDITILLSLFACAAVLFLVGKATGFKNKALVVCLIALGWMAFFLFIAIAAELSPTGYVSRSWERNRVMKMGGLVMKRESKNQCLRCGYDLKGNVSGVCPECGRKVY